MQLGAEALPLDAALRTNCPRDTPVPTGLSERGTERKPESTALPPRNAIVIRSRSATEVETPEPGARPKRSDPDEEAKKAPDWFCVVRV